MLSSSDPVLPSPRRGAVVTASHLRSIPAPKKGSRGFGCFEELRRCGERALRHIVAIRVGSCFLEIAGQTIAPNVRGVAAVLAGQALMILESMKMEIEIFSPANGVIKKLWIDQGQSVVAGQTLVWLDEESISV